MLRHYWAITVLLTTLIGLIAPATAQTTATGTPATAYRQKGKWVGYVPPHQKYSQTEGEEVFRSSLPDVTSFLTGKTDRQVKAAKAVEPLKKSVEPFKGTLLTVRRPHAAACRAVAFDEPTPAFGPGVNVAPEYDRGRDGRRHLFDRIGACATAPTRAAPAPVLRHAEYQLWWTDCMATPPWPQPAPRHATGPGGCPGTPAHRFSSVVRAGNGPFRRPFQPGCARSLPDAGREPPISARNPNGVHSEASSADYRIGPPLLNTVEGQQTPV